jgi:RNA methyltransferase, TrmH family
MKSAVQNRLRLIEGKHNALVKHLRTAFSQGEPTPSGACAIEGLRIVEEAIRSGLRLEAVFFSESASNKAERLLPQLGAQVETVLLPDKLFATTVPTDTPQGMAALVRVKEHSVESMIARSHAGVLIATAGVQDPGNLGTILRSGEAFGAGGILIGENTVSPFNPKVIRASAGSLFRLPFVRTKLLDVIPQLRTQGIRLIATSSHKGVPLSATDFKHRAGVFIGNEGSGLSRELMSEMDEVVVIPHAAQVESLNAGVAASIILYEASRQRSTSQRPATQFNSQSQEPLQ